MVGVPIVGEYGAALLALPVSVIVQRRSQAGIT